MTTTRRTRRLRGTLALASLLVAGTACSGTPEAAPTPSATSIFEASATPTPTSDPTTATPTPSATSAVSGALTADDVAAVLDQLQVVFADARNITLALPEHPLTWPRLPDEVLERVADIYADRLEEQRMEVLHVLTNDENRGFYDEFPDPATHVVEELALAEPGCVIALVDARVEGADASPANWYVLAPRTDDFGHNPTTWEIRALESGSDPQPPTDLCR